MPARKLTTEVVAAGDGVTDDTDAIQVAIDTTPSGGTLSFPVGVYLVSRTLRISNGVSIVGSGTGSVIKASPAWSQAGTLLQVESPGVSLRDFAVDGSRVAQTNLLRGIVLSSQSSHCSVERLSLYDIGGQAVTVFGHGQRIVGNHCRNFGANAIECSAADGTGDIYDIVVAQNHIEDGSGSSGPGGIEFDEGAHDSVIENNVVRNTSESGIQAENGCYNVLVHGNLVHDCGGTTCAGIYAGGVSSYRTPQMATHDIVISGNHVEGGKHGISSTDGASGLVISGNDVSRTIRHGIFASRADYASISGNIVRDCNSERYAWGAGIAYDTGLSGTITGNVCRDTRTGADRTQNYGIMVGSGKATVSGNVCLNNAVQNLYGYGIITSANLIA